MNIDPTDRGAGREAMKGVVLHEIGHAIGMMHEHQHPAGAIIWNEQAVINYFRSFPNPWTLEEIRFNILDKLTDPDEYDMTPERDIQSIMHYWFRPGLLAPGTLAPTSPNNRISSKDAAFISARLACDSGPSADDDDPTPTAADTDLKPNDAKPLPVPGDAVSAEIDTAGKRHLYEIKVPTSNSFTLIETVDGDDSTPPTPMVLEIYDSSTETFTPEKVKHRSRVTSLSKSLLNGFLAEKLSGGTYFVVARHASGYGTGKYTITWRQTVSASNREDGHGSRRMQNIEGTQEEVGSLVYNDEFDKLREAVNSAQQGWPSISSK